MTIRIAPLTKRQREVYEFIARYINDHAYAPSLEEIADAMGLSAQATVHKHLSELEARGYIRRQWNRSRLIELLVGSGCCPTCGRELEKVSDEAKVSLETGRKVDDNQAVGEGTAIPTPT